MFEAEIPHGGMGVVDLIAFLIGVIFLYIPLSIAAMFYAGRLHRSRSGWLLLSLVVSPIVAFAMLFGLGSADDGDEEDEANLYDGRQRPPGRLTSKLERRR